MPQADTDSLSETTPSPSAADDLPLRESIEDARVLLWYAAREGKSLPEGMVPTIVGAQSLLSPGKRDPKLESEFLIAFRNLAAAMQPVSVDSIEATYGYPFGSRSNQINRRLGNAVRTKAIYSYAALFVLALLLITQVYWFIGTAFRTDLEKNREELDRISGAFREMDFKNAAITDLMVIKENRVGRLNANTVDVRGTQLEDITTNFDTSLMDEIKDLKEQRDNIYMEFFNISRRSERVTMILAGDECLLSWWDIATNFLFINEGKESADSFNPCASRASNQTNASLAQYQMSTAEHNANWSAKKQLEFQNGLKTAYEQIVKSQQRVELSLEGSKSWLAILNQYMLPLLYGLLGSLAYTLRSLSIEIQKVTFTRGSDIRYSLRWPLGMLAGVTVGLFFDPAKLSGLAAITPLGLAFLAGYGVELVFTGLDKLVRAFAGDDTSAQKPA